MNRFAKLTLAAGAALTLTAFANGASASTMDIVVPLKGKTAEQIKVDIRAAATTICRDNFRDTLGQFATCIEMVYDDAMTRVPAVLLPTAN